MVPTRHTHSASDSYSSVLFGPYFVLLLVHLRTTVKVHVEQRLLGHNRKRKQPCITSTCDPSQSPILLLRRFNICIKKALISRVFKKKKQNAIAVTEIWPKVEKENKTFTRFFKQTVLQGKTIFNLVDFLAFSRSRIQTQNTNYKVNSTLQSTEPLSPHLTFVKIIISGYRMFPMGDCVLLH